LFPKRYVNTPQHWLTNRGCNRTVTTTCCQTQHLRTML
jgi:hypothetical protein